MGERGNEGKSKNYGGGLTLSFLVWSGHQQIMVEC